MTSPREYGARVWVPTPERDELIDRMLFYNCVSTDRAVREKGSPSIIDDSRVFIIRDSQPFYRDGEGIPRPYPTENGEDEPTYMFHWFTTNDLDYEPHGPKSAEIEDVTDQVKTFAEADRKEREQTKEMEALLGIADE